MARRPAGYAPPMCGPWLPLLALGVAAAAPAAEPEDTLSLDRDALVRVDVPDWPGAVATSSRGSLLLAAPEAGVPWRPEPVPEVDAYVAWEAEVALNSAPWVAAGHDGSGVRVAVFDVQWFNAELGLDELGDVATWDCQAHPSCEAPMDTLRPTFSWEEGSHGVACAEVIRDLAPGVELDLVRVNGLTTLENAAAWAAREGVDLVSMSLSFFGESFYDGTGAVNEALRPMFEAGSLMVTSAGNYAKEHWIEDFEDVDLDGWHEFGGGSEYLPVWLDGAGAHRVLLNWDQYGGCGDTDLDLFVFDGTGDVVGRSEDRQTPGADRCTPTENASAWATTGGWHYLSVRRAAGDPTVRFSVFARNNTISGAMGEGSVTDPGTHPMVFTVGAVRADGYLGNGPESFSSRGPTHGDLAKPDIAGPDGLSSSIYGETGFYGTSASTPAVVAALALVMSREPELTPREAAERLQAWAVPGEPTWRAPDTDLGAGYARLPPLEPRSRGCGEGFLLLPALAWLPLARLRRRFQADSRT